MSSFIAYRFTVEPIKVIFLTLVIKSNETPVHFSSRNESSAGPEIFKILLKNIGNPNAVDQNNLTPVHVAALSLSSAESKLLKILLGNNCKSPAGWPLLQTVHYLIK